MDLPSVCASVLLCLGYLAGGAFGTRQADANAFFDYLLNVKAPELVPTYNLHPYPLKPFRYVVPSNAFTNRDLKVEFTVGAVSNISKGVHRLGNCAPAGLNNGKVTIGCNVALSGVRISMHGNGVGDSYFGSTVKKIEANSHLGNSYILVEIEGSQPLTPTGKIVNYKPHINVLTNLTTDLDLNEERWNNMRKTYETNIKQQLEEMLAGPYRDMLNEALKYVNLPEPKRDSVKSAELTASKSKTTSKKKRSALTA